MVRNRAPLFGFVVPVVVAAAGLTGVAATVASVVLSVAIGVGMAYAARALAPKPKSSARGVRVGLRIDTDAARDVILGHAATGGQLVYWHTYGASNKILQLVIALASHQIDGVSEIRVNGEAVTWNPATGAVTQYPGMTIKVYDGTQTTADAGLVAHSGGRWLPTAVGYNVAYAVCTMEYKAETYPKGIPEFLFRVRGAKLYDSRTGATIYTENPAVIVDNLIRGISVNGLHLIGLRTPYGAVRSDDATASANACDEMIPLAAGGSEKRYRCGIVADCDIVNRDVIQTAAAAMGGKVIHAGGIYRIQAGVAQTAVCSLTDDDIMADAPLTTVPRQARSDLANAIYGSFADPDLGHKMRPLPGRTSAIDEAVDGGIRFPITVEMPSVFSRTQAQRLMELERRRARRMETATMVVRARWSVLEAGDWVTFTSARRGYVGKTFEVTGTSRRQDQKIELSLRATDAAVDDWVPATDELADNTVTVLPPGAAGAISLSPTALQSVTLAAGGGASRPGLRAVWTSPADPTIIEIIAEYRKVGDVTAMERRIASPEAGSYTWLDGIQGGAQYECRFLPITEPRREATWSAWIATPASTDGQVVSSAVSATTATTATTAVTATTALSVPADTITDDMMDPDARWQLRWAQLSEDTSGSLAAHIAELRHEVQTLGQAALTHRLSTDDTRATARVTQMEHATLNEAFAQYRITVDASLAGKAAASVVQTLEGRVTSAEGVNTSQGAAITAVQAQVNDPTTGLATRASSAAVTTLDSRVTSVEGVNTAQATAITQVTTQSGSNASSITQILSDVAGNKRFSIVFDSNGRVTGYMSMDGTTQVTELILGVSAIKVFDPLVNSGAPVEFLKVVDIAGTKHMVLDGTFIARAIEAGTIAATKGSIGILTGTNNEYELNLNTGNWKKSDNTNYFNIATGAMRLG